MKLLISSCSQLVLFNYLRYKVEDLLDILNDSETLEMLISEDPETEKSADTLMDTQFCGKGITIILFDACF